MPFKRYVEIGRVAMVNYGTEYGKLVVISDIVDQNKVCRICNTRTECKRALEMIHSGYDVNGIRLDSELYDGDMQQFQIDNPNYWETAALY